MRSLVAALVLTAGLLVLSTSTASVQNSPGRFRHDGFSFRYPATWTRVNWCWEGTTVTPLVVLTTAHKGPVCTDHTAWFPPTPLKRSGASVWWDMGGVPGLRWFSTVKDSPTVRVGGEPARIATIGPSDATKWPDTGCGVGRGKLALVAQIRPRGVRDDYFSMTACLRGPHFAANRHAVRQMLASVRFAKYWR